MIQILLYWHQIWPNVTIASDWKKSPTTRVKLHIKYIMVTIKTTPEYNSVGKDEA